MLTRAGYLYPRADGPDEARQLEAEGWVVLRQVFAPAEIARLHHEISEIFATEIPPIRVAGRTAAEYADYRHGTFNKSAAAQAAAAHPRILETIEPLLGEDCHIIANTSWRNPADDPRAVDGGSWHCDGGPHVPRPAGVPWDDRIPYPVFAIGVHILLEDCPRACGPTGVLARSHRSGQAPPRSPNSRSAVFYDGDGPVALTGAAGDVAMFVSDTWHRRLPTIPSADTGRFFLQVHYARRDIAQRVELTEHVNHVGPDATRRAKTDRERRLIGLHPPGFYDA